MPLIRPTVGRKVYFSPPRAADGGRAGLYNVIDQDQPLDATILFVYSDHSINVNVIDHHGNQRFLERVPLVHEGQDPPPPEFGYCYWMPYQVGQAKKET